MSTPMQILDTQSVSCCFRCSPTGAAQCLLAARSDQAWPCLCCLQHPDAACSLHRLSHLLHYIRAMLLVMARLWRCMQHVVWGHWILLQGHLVTRTHCEVQSTFGLWGLWPVGQCCRLQQLLLA